MKKTLWFLLCLGLLVVACQGADGETNTLPEHDFAGSTIPNQAIVLQDFELEDVNGPVKLSDFEGQYVVVYFGYTFCPDFCPMTLTQMQSVLAALGEQADQVQVVMITVDPERDTAQRLDEYVTYFDPRFRGLSGTSAQIDAAAAPFGVFYEKGTVAEDENYYLVNHSTRSFLIGPEGDAILSWAHGTPTAGIVSDLQFLIGLEASQS